MSTVLGSARTSPSTSLGVNGVGVNSLNWARTLALATPLALLAGALGSQYIGGLYPCEMCHWQRWPHYAAVPLALLAIALRRSPLGGVALGLAAAAILTSGLIGGFHAGVEYGWWEGVTRCATTVGAGSGDLLGDLMAAPVIRCDVAPWTIGGVSLAGFNFLISTGAALAIAGLVARARA